MQVAAKAKAQQQAESLAKKQEEQRAAAEDGTAWLYMDATSKHEVEESEAIQLAASRIEQDMQKLRLMVQKAKKKESAGAEAAKEPEAQEDIRAAESAAGAKGAEAEGQQARCEEAVPSQAEQSTRPQWSSATDYMHRDNTGASSAQDRWSSSKP